jgi:hypothetical protein
MRDRGDEKLERVSSKLGLATLVACALSACTSGVGDPCVPEEEYAPDFAGFSAEEASAESRSLQCETRVCLVNHFQGRVSCPYGQSEQQATGDPRCFVPGSADPIRSAVSPQLSKRRADDAVYCSCRCNGPDQNARYCECPSGFSCEDVIPKLGLGKEQLAGSYCVREGTGFHRNTLPANEVCDAKQKNCE